MPDVNGGDEDFLDAGGVDVTPEERREMAQYLERQVREARARQQELNERYPYVQGGRTVLGPEVFTDGAVVTWKGQRYVLQSHADALRTVRTIAGIHCGALLELLHDAGIRLPENALHLYQLLYDELTLAMPALAEAHPSVLPRLPEGME